MLKINNFPLWGACMYQFASRSLQWLFRSVMLLDVLAIENHHCVEASAKCDPSLEFLTGNLTWFNCTSLYFDLPWNIDNFNHWKGPMSPMILDKLWPHPAQEVMGETWYNLQDPESAWFSLVNCHCSIILSRLFCRAHNLHVVSSAARNTCTLTSLSSKQHAPSWSQAILGQTWWQNVWASNEVFSCMKVNENTGSSDTFWYHHSVGFQTWSPSFAIIPQSWIHFRPSVPQISAMLRLRWGELWAVGRHVP